MSIARISLVLLASATLVGTFTAGAQATGNAPHISRVSLALTYAAQGSNLTSSTRFWFQGGSAELNATFFHGLGATSSVLGVQSQSSSGGVPINLITVAFGPSYTYKPHSASKGFGFFARGLVGEVDGFKGTYPATGGSISSSNSLGVVAGGGIDLGISRHLALRMVQADYVRSQLPNSLSNVQNSLRLGAGIVLR